MKHFIKRIIAGFIIAFILTGCSIMPTENKTINKKQNAKTKLILWYYWDIAENQQELSNLISEFNRSQNKIEVEARYVPDEDFKKQLSLSVIKKDTPDLVLVDSADHAYYNEMHLFEDLTDKIGDFKEYDETVLNSCKMDGKIYGVPFGINCLALFYNEDMLKKAGCEVPKTWEEFEETAKKLSNQTTYGFGMTALQSEESLYEFLPILWSYGGEIDKINSREGKQAFSVLQDLVRDGSMSRATTNFTLVDLMNQFVNKKVAMMFNSPMVVQTIREKAKDLNWNVTFLPSNGKNISIIGGENWAVLKGKNKDAAIKFVQYVTQKDRVKSYISKFGFLAARTDIMKNQYLGDDVMRKFYEIYQYSRQREITPKWPLKSEVISNAMSETIMNGKDLDKTLKEAQQNMDNILKEEK